MSDLKNKNEEEVDLGTLFMVIGRLFSRFFNFIVGIIKGIFHLLIIGLLFLKKNIVKIAIATIVGGVIGSFFQVISPVKYSSQMLIEPNYKSSRQLYNNIRYYSDLVKQKDTVQLKELFNLSMNEAISLKKFEMEPLRLENDIIQAYNSLIVSVDTLTIKSYSYEEFKESFTDFDYRFHKLTVEAEKNDVFQRLGEVVIKSVVENKFLKKYNRLNNENIDRTSSVYKKNLTQLDSLHQVYLTAILEEAKKETAGTSVDMGGSQDSAKELELFETGSFINSELRKLTQEKSRVEDVVNVISEFQPIGSEIKGITKNFISLFALGGFLLMIALLLLVELNTYLNNYLK